MNYYALGDIVRKVQPNVALTATLPNTKHFNASHVLVEQFSSGGPVPVLDKTGSIVYSRKSKRFPKRSNLCAHNRYERMSGTGGVPSVLLANDLNPAHPGWTWEVYWDYVKAYEAHIAATPIALAALAPTLGLAKLQAGWQNYAAIGFQAVQPDLTKLSLPNFIIDADQLLDLARDVKLVKTAGQLITGIPKSSVPSLRDAAKFLAGKRLSYKFGWKPTIGDLTAMLNVVLGLRAQLQVFKTNIGKEMSFTKVIETLSVGKSGTFNLDGDSHYRVDWTGGLISQVKYHARYVPQQIAAVNELDESIRLLLEGLGANLDPQILWDAIPFSFVVDWFLNVGDWVHQFRKLALDLQIDIVDSSVSYKEDYTVTSSLTVNPAGFGFLTSTTKPAGYYTRNRFFHRIPVDPSIALYKQLGWKNPTGSQWINLIALATVLAL